MRLSPAVVGQFRQIQTFHDVVRVPTKAIHAVATMSAARP